MSVFIPAGVLYQGNLVKLDGSLNRSSVRQVAKQSDGTIWCVYVKDDDNDTSQVYVAYSSDGINWTEVALTATASGLDQWRPCIAIDSSDVVHIVWNGYDSDWYSHIYYKSYTDSWQDTESLTAAGIDADTPAIAVDSSDNVYVVWEQRISGYNNIVFYDKTSDTATNIGQASRQNYEPAIAIDSSNVIHVVFTTALWHPPGIYYRNVRYRKYTDSWQAIEDVTDSGVHRFGPCVATDSNDYVHVSWYTGYYVIYYSRRESASADWANNLVEVVDGGTDTQSSPSIALDSSDVVTVAWTGKGYGDNPTVYNIQLRQKTAGGWQDQVAITDSYGANTTPNLLWDGHRVPPAYSMLWNRLAYITTPVGTTDPATDRAETSTTLNGTLDDYGGEACDCGFEWGETTAYGTITPTESKETGETFSQAISGLTPGKHYHFRAIVTNSAGTSYGSDRQFFAGRKGGNPNIDQRMFQHVERIGR